jgi:hypothetical protein
MNRSSLFFVRIILSQLFLLTLVSDLAGKVLGGWELSGIRTFHTGFPWTPVIGQCVSTLGPSQCPTRPAAYSGGAGTSSSNDAFITGSNFPGGGAAFFDTSAPNGRLPGIGRNSFRGPKYRSIDVTIAKRFGLPNAFGEAANLEVKANFFNIFNILNLQPFSCNTDSTNVQNPSFGRALAGLSGRVVEIQGRITF